MRFARLMHEDEARLGLVEDNDLLLLPKAWGDLTDVIATGDSGREVIAALRAERSLPRVALSGAKLLSPIGRFRRDILCTGWNYWDHFEEGRGKREGQD